MFWDETQTVICYQLLIDSKMVRSVSGTEVSSIGLHLSQKIRFILNLFLYFLKIDPSLSTFQVKHQLKRDSHH